MWYRMHTKRKRGGIRMNKAEILRKVEANEGLTVEEIKEYQKLVKPQQHVYGKYGNLALKYLEEHNSAKLWALAGELPEYLHNIDKEADDLYEVMHDKLSKDERYKRTGNFLEDVKRENTIKMIIEEEILNTIVYV